MMARHLTRREVLRAGLAATSLLAASVPEWAMPALAQGEVDVPFTDVPAGFNANPSPTAAFRRYDTRRIGPEAFFTPRDEFFAIGHNGVPEVDADAYRLQVTGLVGSPMKLTLAELQAREAIELPAG
jgi:DMSO/TMAO reductase YedYZ molybdopterin-dependent catalytic subunit